MAVAAQKPAMDSTTVNILLIGGLGLLVYNKLFGKSKEEKATEKEEEKLESLPLQNNPLSSQTYTPTKKAPAGFIYVRSTTTKPAVPSGYLGKAAKQIKDAIGTFTDDEGQIVAGIKMAATKAELNIIAKSYEILYKRDLMYDLKDNLSKKEMLPILTYINKLPDYIKGYKTK